MIHRYTWQGGNLAAGDATRERRGTQPPRLSAPLTSSPISPSTSASTWLKIAKPLLAVDRHWPAHP